MKGTFGKAGNRGGKIAWRTPDTGSESESEDEIVYDGKGERIVHDFWPSRWRANAADEVNGDKTTKTVHGNQNGRSSADDRYRKR